jgi:hypothetical protein
MAEESPTMRVEEFLSGSVTISDGQKILQTKKVLSSNKAQLKNELTLATRALPSTQAPSNHSFFASRALARLHSRNPGVLGIFRPNTGDLTEVRTSRSLQHKITELVDAADLIIVKN